MVQKSSVASILKSRALVKGVKVKLASGKESDFYVDCKRATLHGPSLQALSKFCVDALREFQPDLTHVAGVSVGGDPLVAGVILEAAHRGLEWSGLLVRKEKKSHGLAAGRAVDGEEGNSTKAIWLVEDVVSTGGSSLTAARHLLDEGYSLKGILCLVDRNMGGLDMLTRELRIPVKALSGIDEILTT
jgi:orotate phosphoribosyltransferase